MGITFALLATAGVDYAFGAERLGGITTIATVLIYLLLVYSLWWTSRRRVSTIN